MTTKEAARSRRVSIYSQWIADDVDGLVHNLSVESDSTAILADAKQRVVHALAALDSAIAADRAAHSQEHV